MNKRIEVYALKGCKPCDDALRKLIPLAEEMQIQISILPPTEDNGVVTVPRVCVIGEEDGIETRECIEGYGENTVKDVEDLLNERGSRKKPE